MPLTEDNYLEAINSLRKNDWKPLFDLIPTIEKTKNFGSQNSKQYIESSEIQMFADTNKVVQEFQKTVYDIPIIIDFDWISWDEGRKMVSAINFNYDTIDIPTKCKIISAIVRNDRFNEGVLASQFESGTILKILKSIQNQVEDGK